MTLPYKRTIEPVRERIATPIPGPVDLTVRLAESRADVLRCQYLIADVYNTWYRVVFSRHKVDLSAKIEPYPHRYAMGMVGDQLVAACGLYVDDTYIQKFGHVTADDLRAQLVAAGCSEAYPRFSAREYTKLVIHPDWAGRGIGRLFFAMTHTRDFIQADGDPHGLLLCCAKRSVFEGLHHTMGIGTRIIRPFPIYRVHDLYSSPADPMDSRLMIPPIDIPAKWYDLGLPATLPVGTDPVRTTE